jgi:hypothetical protein
MTDKGSVMVTDKGSVMVTDKSSHLLGSAEQAPKRDDDRADADAAPTAGAVCAAAPPSKRSFVDEVQDGLGFGTREQAQAWIDDLAPKARGNRMAYLSTCLANAIADRDAGSASPPKNSAKPTTAKAKGQGARYVAAARAKPTFTPEDRQRAAVRVLNGERPADVAVELGCGMSTVGGWASSLKGAIRGNVVNRGRGEAEVAEEYGVNLPVVENLVAEERKRLADFAEHRRRVDEHRAEMERVAAERAREAAERNAVWEQNFQRQKAERQAQREREVAEQREAKRQARHDRYGTTTASGRFIPSWCPMPADPGAA